MTNSLLVAVTNTDAYTGTNNASTTNLAVFRTVGASSHYLTDGTYRDQGTTNINPELLAHIQRRTTYPPLILSNAWFLADTNLNPTTARHTDTPDYLASNCLFQDTRLYLADLYDASEFTFRNGLFLRGSLNVDHYQSGDWVFEDNAFDGTVITEDVTYGLALAHGYNAYLSGASRLMPTNENDRILSAFTYAPGPLGSFYQDDSNVLIDAGSQSASDAGLYIEITHPLPNFLYTSLSIIRFEASAQDADDSVTNVQFLVNSNLIGSVSQSPFTWWTTNEFDWGSYFAEAVAYDDQGASNGSSVVRFRVVLDTVPIVLITSPMNGDVFSTSETVEIEAFVNITDDGSNPVVFFDGETKLGDGCSFSIPF